MRIFVITTMAVLLLAAPGAAQLALPTGQVGIPPVTDITGDLTDQLGETVETTEQTVSRQARRLLQLRDRKLDLLLRQNRDAIERDIDGNLARRGVLLIEGLNNEGRLALIGAGFTIVEREEIAGLGFAVHRLAPPEGMSIAEAEVLARKLSGDAEVSADNLYFQAGQADLAMAAMMPMTMQASRQMGTEVGVIDGASGAAVAVIGEKGFAVGAPSPSDHGTAVANLLSRAGVTRIRIADVYGTDPAGGNALAIAKALGWLTSSGSKVITISLVGPRNGIVERAIRAAQARGVVVVAAVGNDGPASPPAYPASFDGVIAVTGVDARRRPLIEAGRALHLDYAAPGADVFAFDRKGRTKKWRGTSFAAPLVAARVASAIETGGDWRARLDREARDLGPKGPDDTFGRGLLCEGCAQKK